MDYAPRGLKSAGRRLWRAVVAEFELAEYERAILAEACKTADMCETIAARVAESGAIAGPGLVELRQQRLALARLVASLKLPSGLAEDPNTTPYRKRAIR